MLAMMTSLRNSVQKASRVPSRMIQRESKPAGRATALHPLLRLQQTIGNQAVCRLIQARLKVGQPGDKYEQEADRVADTVMRMPEPSLATAVPISRSPRDVRVQQVCPDCEEELQRQLDEEEELLQVRETPGRTPQVTPEGQAHIDAMQAGGQLLPDSVRAFFEPLFGYDFSQVRVHTDARAAETARGVNALAFTVGRDIVFGGGQYTPETNEGRRLLGHELTHVVQQGLQTQYHREVSRGSLSVKRRETQGPGYGRDTSHGTPDTPLKLSFGSGREVIRREEAPKPKELAPLKGSAVDEARAALEKRGLPPKLVPSSTVSWTFDPTTGSFVLKMPKQLEFKLPSGASLKIGPELTGTMSNRELIVKKGLQGTKPLRPWVDITQVIVKDPNVEFQHFGGPTVVPIADLPSF